MTRGLYIAASGMLNGLQRQDSIANNLANLDTPGYKRDVTLSEAFPSMLLRRIHDLEQITPSLKMDRRPIIGKLGTGVLPSEVAQDFAQGSLQYTANSLDLAIVDPPPLPNQPQLKGFFVIQTSTGPRYTRNGSFQLNAQRQLITTEGQPVLDTQNRPIVLPSSNVQIDEDGRLFTGGNAFVRLQIAGIDPRFLVKQGDSLYVSQPGTTVSPMSTGTIVRSGYLERSNVNVITEMVDMISVLRAYEASQRALLAQDEATEVAILQVARSR